PGSKAVRGVAVKPESVVHRLADIPHRPVARLRRRIARPHLTIAAARSAEQGSINDHPSPHEATPSGEGLGVRIPLAPAASLVRTAFFQTIRLQPGIQGSIPEPQRAEN